MGTVVFLVLLFLPLGCVGLVAYIWYTECLEQDKLAQKWKKLAVEAVDKLTEMQDENHRLLVLLDEMIKEAQNV